MAAKTDVTVRKVQTGHVDLLQKVLGTFDENLNIIVHETGVNIRLEGTTVVITGKEEYAALAATVVENLLRLAEQGESPDKGRVEYLLELAHEGRAGDILKLSSGTIAVTAKGKPVKCKTMGQKRYVDCIKKSDVTFGIGPAGTGKTYLAVCLAVQELKQHRVEKIILTRPAVEAGEKLGFLPGDLQEKVDPYLRPLYDALYEMLGLDSYAKYVERGAIEIAPLAYMRGRTLSNAFIILDEAQNSTREQMKMFLTRLGDGSRMVVTGDITQIDLPDGRRSGLIHAAKLLEGTEGVSCVYLTDSDVVRNPMVMRIVKAYEQEEEQMYAAKDRKGAAAEAAGVPQGAEETLKEGTDGKEQ
ncbi:MAG: PhoH family protein [Clostridia bacterium]|nr:PhoH family protein [Clostridia bacterium]